MHKTIASPDGGYNEELTPAEAVKTKAEWKKNAAEEKARKKAQELEDKLADEGMDALCAGLPPAEAAALKKKLKV